MDNPDTIVGMAGFYGMALASESYTMLSLAAFSQLSNFFVHRTCRKVTELHKLVSICSSPHMKKLHGTRLRPINGITSAVLDIFTEMADKNPRLKKLNQKAQHEIQKYLHLYVVNLCTYRMKKRVLTQISGINLNIKGKWKPRVIMDVYNSRKKHQKTQ